MYTIRHSESKDLPAMLAIYEEARTFMAAHGNPRQWGQRGWPPEELLRKDIALGRSYVILDEEDNIAGTFCFLYGYRIEPTYASIDEGNWSAVEALGEKLGNTYGVIHRIAMKSMHHGAGTFAINWAYDQCHHLRIDTHPDNKVMQNLLKKLHFQYCGIIYVYEDHDPRLAFEKFERNV